MNKLKRFGSLAGIVTLMALTVINLSACGSLETVQAKAVDYASAYCARPALERVAVRETVNSAIASVGALHMHCNGDPLEHSCPIMQLVPHEHDDDESEEDLF